MTRLPASVGSVQAAFPVSNKLGKLANGRMWNWPSVATDGAVWAAAAFTLGRRFAVESHGSRMSLRPDLGQGIRPHLGQGISLGSVLENIPFVAGGSIAFYVSDFLPGPIGTVAKIGAVAAVAYGLWGIVKGDGAAPGTKIEPKPEWAEQTPQDLRHVTGTILKPADGGAAEILSTWGGFMIEGYYNWEAVLTNRGDRTLHVTVEYSVQEFPLVGTRTVQTKRVDNVILEPGVPKTVKSWVPMGINPSMNKADAVAVVNIYGSSQAPSGWQVTRPSSYRIGG